MDIDAIPLFAMLRSKLGYLTQREQLIAQNVANSDTPGYAPRDLTPFSFAGEVDRARAAEDSGGPTLAGHIALSPMPGAGAAGARAGFKPVTGADSETTLDGNQVVLEDQMIKMNEARMDYDAAIGFYQKSLGLLRMAARAPGR